MGVLATTAVEVRADVSKFHSEASAGILGSVTRIAASAAAVFGGIQLGKGLFNATIKSAADFQTTLKVLQATAGTSDANLKRLSATAIKLGADVHLPATSAASAADAMLQLGRAGFSTNQIIAASHGVLLLATAAEVDNATAADMVTKAIGAFGLKAKDAGMVVNDFAGAANASQSSLADVGDAVTQAGAGFHALRIPVADAATAIAEMAKQGITGGMAGAALNTAFTRLATPTTAAKNVMKDMGVQLFDNNGKFVGLRAAIEQMSPKLAQMTDQQRLHTLSVLGGTRGMKALSDVLGVGVKSWDATHAAVTRAGQAQAIANAKTSGFNGAVLALKNTLGTLALNIGIAVIPSLTRLVTWLGRIASAPNIDVAVRIIWKGIAAFAGDLKDSIQKALFGGTDQVIMTGSLRIGQEKVVVDPGLVVKLRDALATMVEAQDWGAIGARIGAGISGAIKITTDAMNGMLTAMLAWVNSHSSQIASVGAVIGLTILSKLLDPAFWAAHWQLIGGLVLSAASFAFPEGKLAVVGEKLAAGALSTFGATAGRLLTAALELLPGKFGEAAPKLVTGAGNMLAKVVTEMTFYGVRIVDALVTAIAGLTGRLSGVVKTLIYTGIVGIIGGAVADAAKAAVRLGERIVTGVVSGLTGIGKAALNQISQITNEVNQVAQDVWSAATRIGARLISGVLAGLTGLGAAVKNKIESTFSSVLSHLDFPGLSPPEDAGAHAIGRPIAKGAVDGLVAGLAPVGPVLGARMAALLTALKPVLDKFGDDAASSTTTAGHKIIAAAKVLEDPIAEGFKAWITKAKANIDAQFAAAQTTIEGNLAKAKAKIDAWKAQATPTEALLAAQQAQAAAAAVELAVTTASKALEDLKAKQAKDWADLLATQAKNMAALKASVQATATTAFIAEHEVNKDLAGSQGDPLATNLLYAHQSLDNIIALFNQGQATQAQLLAAQDEYDAAVLAASGDTNAQKLDSDYVTWQGLVAQQAAGSASITAQEQADAAARLALQQQFGTDKQTAVDAMNQALYAQQQFAEQQLATSERADRDRRAGELNAALVARYNRIKTHLDNVVSATNANFAELGRMATKSGGDIGQNLAAAMRAAIPAVNSAAAALAQTVSRYLKTNSPTEAGPMSDLDKWWDALAPTLLASLDDSSIKAALSNAVTPIPGGAIGSSAQQTVKLDERVSQDLRDLVTYLKQNAGSTSPTRTGDVNVVVVPTTNAEVYRSRR